MGPVTIALQCLLGCTCIGLFVFAARLERESPWLWGGLAGAVWILAWPVLGGGLLHTAFAEALLYGIMASWLACRARRGGGGRIRK